MNWRRIDNHAWQSHCGTFRVCHSVAMGRDRFSLFEKVPDDNERSGYRFGWLQNFDTGQLARDAAEQISNDKAVLPGDYEK